MKRFTYDNQIELNAPPGVTLKGIRVTIELEPDSGACLIYGYQADGDMACVQIHGAKTELELPFAKPTIYVKYLDGLKHLTITTCGYREEL